MAGYNWKWGKSNNAVSAEQEGKMTASRLAKVLKCSTGAVRDILRPTEWHHTSGWYNITYYYDEPLLIALATGQQDLDDFTQEEVEEAREVLERLRARGSALHERLEWRDCEVRYLDWFGPRTRRRACEARMTGCKVTYNGRSSIDVTGPTGKVFRKRIDCNGLEVYDAAGRRIWLGANQQLECHAAGGPA